MDGTRPSYRIVLGVLLVGVGSRCGSRHTTVLMAVGAVSALVHLMALCYVGNLLDPQRTAPALRSSH